MKYDFDKPTCRRGTGSLKWDVAEHELPMWVADMDFETPEVVKNAIIKTAQHGIFGYSTESCEYFSAIADFWETRHGYRFEPSDMVYCTGVIAAISSMVRKLTTPAENVLLLSPGYNTFHNSIRNSGRNILECRLVCSGEDWSVDYSDLEAKLSNPQTSLMILCNPHNPIGKIWDRETLAKIGELAKINGVTVISDEIHCALTSPDKNYIPFASVNEVCADISVTCISASKAFNLAGLQSACVIAKNPHLRHKVWRGINTDEVGEPNAFAMSANIAAFRHGGEWLDALRAYIYENKRFAVAYLKDNAPRLGAHVSDATYLLWVDISAYSSDSAEFARDLRAKTGLYISAGTVYGEGGEHFVRINLATQRANVERGMRLLADYVNAL